MYLGLGGVPSDACYEKTYSNIVSMLEKHLSNIDRPSKRVVAGEVRSAIEHMIGEPSSQLFRNQFLAAAQGHSEGMLDTSTLRTFLRNRGSGLGYVCAFNGYEDSTEGTCIWDRDIALDASIMAAVSGEAKKVGLCDEAGTGTIYDIEKARLTTGSKDAGGSVVQASVSLWGVVAAAGLALLLWRIK